MSEHEQQSARSERLAAFVLLGIPALVVLAATFVSNGATRIYSWPWAFYIQTAMLVPWLWCAWSAARGRHGLRAGWWIALPLLVALVVSIVSSTHWHDALEASLILSTPLVLLPFLAQLWMAACPRDRRITLRCIGAIFGILGVVSLWTCFRQAPDTSVVSWFFAHRNPHPLGHWNYTGGLTLLGLPVTFLLVWRERGTMRTVWSVAILILCIQLLSAGSRGAVLGLLAAALTVGAALCARRRWSLRSGAIGFAVLIAVGSALVLTNPRLRQAVAEPVKTLRTGESEQQRLGFILTGLRVGAAHPWSGIGPGTTPYHYPTYRVDMPGSLENSFQLHCGPVQWWVDTGFLGLAALALAVVSLKLRAWRARRSLSPEAIAALALIAGYGAMWLTDYQLDVPVFPILAALAAAVFLAETSGDAVPSGPPQRWVGPLFAIVPLAGVIVLVGSWQARASFAAAWRAKDAGDANGFIEQLRIAANSARWHPYYQNHLARALAAVAADRPSDFAAGLRDEARETWRHSIAISPAQDHPWLNLGWLALADGLVPEAVNYFARAAAIQPRRTGLWYGTAVAHLAQNQTEPAVTALAREIRLDPSFITSPLWREEPCAAMRPAVLALLAAGWTGADQKPGAGPAPDIAAFGRWWWTGEATPFGSPDPTSPTQRFLRSLPRINDRAVSLEAGILPPALDALRETWRTGAPIKSSLVPAEIATLWQSHVAEHPGDAFSLLLKTISMPSIRRVQRSADGILFRQVDGDPLSDLTEMPANGLAMILRPIMPPPRVEEYMDGSQTTRLTQTVR